MGFLLMSKPHLKHHPLSIAQPKSLCTLATYFIYWDPFSRVTPVRLPLSTQARILEATAPYHLPLLLPPFPPRYVVLSP